MKLLLPKNLQAICVCSVTISTALAISGCSQIKGALQPPDTSPSAHIVRLSDQQQGAHYQQQGVMAEQDYLHLAKIRGGMDQTQKLSDADVTFLVQQLSSLPAQTTSPNKVQAEEIVLGHTYSSPGHKPKRLTPSQRSRLYNAIVPYTKSPDQWVQVEASLALAGTRDSRAIPVLEHMAQNSPYSVVRLDANTWLKRLKEVHVTPDK